jgi:peptide/nickel transport system substrate-binding protein
MRTHPVNELVSELEAGRMSRRRFVTRATALGVSSSVIGSILSAVTPSIAAAATPKKGGIAQIALAAPSQKASLDPIKMASDPEQFMTGLLYDPLVNVDETSWEVKPGLAESWVIGPGAREWTFTLRKGVKFHNGKPLTAADVVYTIKRHLSTAQGSPLLARLTASMSASGVTAVNDHTVHLKLARADAYMGVALAYQWAGIVPAGFTNQGVGTGPFKLKSWQPGIGFEMDRNPDYWMPGQPYLDVVRAIVINDPSAKIQSIVAGASDVSNYIEPSSATTVTSGGGKVLRAPNQAFQPIVFPKKTPPFNNPLVMQALKLAVNREQIVQIGLDGNGSVVPDVPVSPVDPSFPKGLSTAQNIPMAKALLKKAGFPNGISFTLGTSDAVSHLVDIAVVFAQSVAPAGFKVNVQKAPVQTYFDQYFLGKRPFIDWWNREQVLDIAALLYREHAPFNETFTASTQMDNLLDTAEGITAPAAANGEFAKAMTVLSQQGNQVIAAFSTELIAAKKNFFASPSTRYIVDFRTAYFS